jgi:hypothetical protein
MKSKRVRDALASLDGMVFNSKEAIEDAIFPLFSKLQDMFHGEGHRDLVDRLINAKWLEVVKGKWQLTLPAPEKFGTEPAIVDDGTKPEPGDTPAFDTQPAFKAAIKNAMTAILLGDDKEAIRILTKLL